MDLKDIMLSEINQTEKDKYCMTYICNNNNKKTRKENKLIDTENRLMGARSRGLGVGEMGELVCFSF